MDEAVEPEGGAAVRRTRSSAAASVSDQEPSNDRNRETGPADSSGTAYWSCVVLGISCLLPWNLFITANEYFSHKFHSPNGSNSTKESDLSSSFEVYFTLTGSAAAVLAAFLNVYLTSHVSSNRRMVGGHILVVFSLIVSIVFCFINTDRWRVGFLALNLILIIFGQFGCMFIAGSTFSIAAQLPEARFTNAVVSATAFCGIFTSVINIISIAVGSGGRPSIVGAVYFSIALTFMLFSLGTYFALLKNSYAQHYLKKTVFNSLNDDVEPLINDQQAENADDDDLLSVRVGSRATVATTRRSLWAVVRKTLYHGVVLVATMAATLTCFPSLTSLVESTAEPASEWHTYFTPVACFLMFNTMDFIGRLFGNHILWPKPGSVLIGLFASLRFGFVFLFLFCNLPPYGGSRRIFGDDAYFVFFIAVFGLTNGYLANLASVYLPYTVEEQDRERAGASTAFYSAAGVLLGAVVSLFVVNQVTG